MLGYRGRSNRREFMAGAALLTIGPMAFSMLVKPAIPWIFSTFERGVALVIALVLTLLVCAIVIVWFWGWTALATRRARDIGLPAWAGVLSLVALVGVGRMSGDLAAPYAMIAGWCLILIWLGVLGLSPSAIDTPRKTEPDQALNAA